MARAASDCDGALGLLRVGLEEFRNEVLMFGFCLVWFPAAMYAAVTRTALHAPESREGPIQRLVDGRARTLPRDRSGKGTRENRAREQGKEIERGRGERPEQEI